jgi:hypothetical protein
MGGLLVGFEPVGGDPDRLYRPLKEELGRHLARNTLPFWSDRLGLGIPLVAESHVAAYYPLNWIIYEFLGVSAAYRLAMWLHYVFLAASTYGYARFLGSSGRGAAIAAIGFTFCGFQAIHSSHEPFYHALPFMPLCLLLAEWYLAGGRRIGLVLLASAWACQLTLGHFQLQLWTAGLVALVALWRALLDGRPWRRLPAVMAALGWGAAMASVQLAGSWELAGFVGFTRRSFYDLAFFSLPPAHLVELVVPAYLRGIPGGPESPYWYRQGTTGYEACLYVGTVPLILSVLALRRDRLRPLVPWVFVAVAGVLLAVMPTAWPSAYRLVVQLPGFGLFRAPGRYAVLASLALCLMASRGLDVLQESRRPWIGLLLAWLCAIAAALWGVYWATRADHRAFLAGGRLWAALGLAAFCWSLATVLLLKARSSGGFGAALLVLATAVELGGLYYTSTTVWGWAIRLPGESPVLARLAAEEDVTRVAGLVHDLPLRAGRAPLFPYTGFAPPPPHPSLEMTTHRLEAYGAIGLARMKHFGATHGIWDGPVDSAEVETLYEGDDPALDRLVYKGPDAPPHARWRLVRHRDVFPEARAAVRVRIAPGEASLLSAIDHDPDAESVWYLAVDRPPDAPGPIAHRARVLSWDGRTAIVEHDGTCDQVIRRTYYPGWTASVDDGPEQPVRRAELGIQSVRLTGSGPSRVRFTYRPIAIGAYAPVSAVAVALALLALLFEAALAARPLFRPR